MSHVGRFSLADRFARYVEPDPNSGCWLWTGRITTTGYGQLKIDGKDRRVHRVSWELANGPIPAGVGHHGTCVCHRCDTPLCVNPDHLFLGTNAENIADRMAKGRSHRDIGNTSTRGERNGKAKLTSSQVLAIRSRLARGCAQKVLAAEFSVDRSTISHIKRGAHWRHI